MNAAAMQQAQTASQQKNALHSAPQAKQGNLELAGGMQSEFADNHPLATAQRRLQEIANNSPQARQLQAIQQMAQSSIRAKQFKTRAAMMFNTVLQNVGNEEPLQKHATKADIAQSAGQASAKPNNTGLPDNLKSGIESLAGMSMDHVKVHYNSSQPAQLNAHAYAQGSEIHVAPGQEQHLPHEAWHVVQQAQGRVQPTMQMKGNVSVNDDAGLEAEADLMGAKALGTVQKRGKEDSGMSEQIPLIEAQSSHMRAHIIQPHKIALPSASVQQTNEGSITVQRKVFLSDISDEPMGEGEIRAWYNETFGKDIPARLRNSGLRLLVESTSSIMLNSFDSDPTNFLDLIALEMTEKGNAGDRRTGSEWLAGRSEQIEKEAAEAGPDSFDPSGMKILIDEDAVKVFIDTHQDKHQNPDSVIYGPWQYKRGTRFASGRGAGWHATHTADTIKKYALNLLKTGALQEGGKVIPPKTPMEDGYIYDAVIIMIGGVIFITYHCNPIENED